MSRARRGVRRRGCRHAVEVLERVGAAGSARRPVFCVDAALDGCAREGLSFPSFNEVVVVVLQLRDNLLQRASCPNNISVTTIATCCSFNCEITNCHMLVIHNILVINNK